MKSFIQLHLSERRGLIAVSVSKIVTVEEFENVCVITFSRTPLRHDSYHMVTVEESFDEIMRMIEHCEA